MRNSCLRWCSAAGQGATWVLRGCAQVMFQESALCGLLFFIAVFIAAGQAHELTIAVGCLLGTATSTVTAAILLPAEREKTAQGLYGYNGCLIGTALPFFLAATPLMWGVLMFCCLLSVMLTAAMERAFAVYRLPVLTAPFVLISWIALLASYHFAALKPGPLPVPVLPHVTAVQTALPLLMPDALLSGVSQVFLLQSDLAGMLMLLGLACSSWRAMLCALGGSIVAFGFAWLMSADAEAFNDGLYSFSAVLTAVALGAAFPFASWRDAIGSVLGVLAAVLVQSALNTLLMPLGMPAFTMPFVVVTWCCLLARPKKQFDDCCSFNREEVNEA
ncbi:urea transporter [Mixta intestinalis]|jgi:urea transporter|uniref:Urea transporter n=1 Tax=Mixta intestinalis TaxID=1615494 RepID=A0A6P1PW77_9GAMM|nr:urea transporter [Mixta intestinalis]QHM70058.1 Urea transporter [Mixta intestinalis]